MWDDVSQAAWSNIGDANIENVEVQDEKRSRRQACHDLFGLLVLPLMPDLE